jgi:hypothetical protein
MVASSHSPDAKISSGDAYSGSSSGLFIQAEGSYSSSGDGPRSFSIGIGFANTSAGSESMCMFTFFWLACVLMAPQRLSRPVHGCRAGVAYSESSVLSVSVGPSSSLSTEECNIAIRDWMYSSLSSTVSLSSRWLRSVGSRSLCEVSVTMHCLQRNVPSKSGSL